MFFHFFVYIVFFSVHKKQKRRWFHEKQLNFDAHFFGIDGAVIDSYLLYGL